MTPEYDAIAMATARQLTQAYSTSFSAATRLFPASMRADIYNIYGMVRVADEIVDTYRGANSRELLDSYETSIHQAIKGKYSTDLILHAFQLTANKYGIDTRLTEPFFNSMRIDIDPPKHFDENQYKTYIYGSAEVVGLMCLKVFCDRDENLYNQLENGAKALGSAFQKVNFLRDVAYDMNTLGRCYFPGVGPKLTDSDKDQIITDIKQDFEVAAEAIERLPVAVRPAVKAAYSYYFKLLIKLENTSADKLMTTRIRINNGLKTAILAKTYVKAKVVK